MSQQLWIVEGFRKINPPIKIDEHAFIVCYSEDWAKSMMDALDDRGFKDICYWDMFSGGSVVKEK